MKRVVTLLLVVAFAAAPVFAQDQPIHKSIEHAAAAAAAEQPPPSSSHHNATFWSGLALGVAGATTSVLGLTVFRVEDSSTGNAPPSTYQTCVAQKSNPVYATNNCDALKGKNLPLLWSGVAVSALGGVLMIHGSRTSAEVTANGFRLSHTIRF